MGNGVRRTPISRKGWNTVLYNTVLGTGELLWSLPIYYYVSDPLSLCFSSRAPRIWRLHAVWWLIYPTLSSTVDEERGERVEILYCTLQYLVVSYFDPFRYYVSDHLSASRLGLLESGDFVQFEDWFILSSTVDEERGETVFKIMGKVDAAFKTYARYSRT